MSFTKRRKQQRFQATDHPYPTPEQRANGVTEVNRNPRPTKEQVLTRQQAVKVGVVPRPLKRSRGKK